VPGDPLTRLQVHDDPAVRSLQRFRGIGALTDVMKLEPRQSAAADSDERLIRAVAAGDDTAFRTLYRRHTPRVRALVGRMLGGHEADTDDVLQDTWVRAVVGLQSFRGDSTLGTWLSSIGIKVAWELIRRRRPGILTDMLETPSAPMPDTIARVDLDVALSRLPDAYRIVVVLHDVEGYTHDEIARQLGVAEGTSKSNLSRARRALRAMLESHERIAK
jgi:RNA polymerase sigma factor (sigma-70 family)